MTIASSLYVRLLQHMNFESYLEFGIKVVGRVSDIDDNARLFSRLPLMALIGRGTDAESEALENALSGLSNADFARLRICYDVPGRPCGTYKKKILRLGGPCIKAWESRVKRRFGDGG